MSLKQNLLITASFALSLALALPMNARAESADATSTATVAASSTAVKTSATPDAAKSKDTSPVTHAEFEELLKNTLYSNPEIVMESVKRLHDKHEMEVKKEMGEALEKHKAELLSDTKSPRVGDVKQTDITLIEFFDYHCGFCKKMLPTLTQIIGDDKKVHVIFREFPILSEDSVYAARAAIAA